jgi:hypothetical protein
LTCPDNGGALESPAPVSEAFAGPAKPLPGSDPAWQDFFTAAFNEHEGDRFLLEEPEERY